jgi:hypothetical protein
MSIRIPTTIPQNSATMIETYSNGSRLRKELYGLQGTGFAKATSTELQINNSIATTIK